MSDAKELFCPKDKCAGTYPASQFPQAQKLLSKYCGPKGEKCERYCLQYQGRLAPKGQAIELALTLEPLIMQVNAAVARIKSYNFPDTDGVDTRTNIIYAANRFRMGAKKAK